MIFKGLYVILAYIILYRLTEAAAKQEREVRCGRDGGGIELQEGDVARLTTADYPLAMQYGNSSCLISFHAPPGGKLQLSFINGCLDDEQEIVLYGLEEPSSGTLIVRVNTALAYGDNAERYSYMAGSNLTVEMALFDYEQWFGFEAIVRILDESIVNASDHVMDLSEAFGAVDFGVSIKHNGTLVDSVGDSIAAVTTWTIRPRALQAVKIVVRGAKLCDSCNLTFSVGDMEDDRVVYNSSTYAYYFGTDQEVIVAYDSPASGEEGCYGFLAYASSYLQNVEANSTACGEYSGTTITLGSDLPDLTIKSGLLIDEDYYSFFSVYPDNQECWWAFAVESGYEMHAIVQRIETETYCDFFTLHAEFNDSGEVYVEESGIDTFSDRYFTFDRDTIASLNLTWKTDGTVALDGFTAELLAIDCACVQPEVVLTQASPMATLHSFAWTRFCNNASCEHTITAPDGFTLAFQFWGQIRNISGDSLVITDGNDTTLYNLTGGGFRDRKFSDEVFVESGGLRVYLTTGNQNRYSSTDGYGEWQGKARIIPGARKLRTVLNTTYGSVYRVSNDIAIWTVASAKDGNIEVLALGAIQSDETPEDFLVLKGDENGIVIGNLGLCTSVVPPAECTGVELTIVRKDFVQTTDFTILVRHSSQRELSCTGGDILELTRYRTPFAVNASDTKSCVLTVVHEHFEYSENRYISLSEVKYRGTSAQNPIQIMAGASDDGDRDYKELMTLSGSGTIGKDVEFHERVMSFLMPPGSSIEGIAYEYLAAPTSRSISCGTFDFLSSIEYSQPNYRHAKKITYNMSIPIGVTDIHFEVTADLPNNATLTITPKPTGKAKTYKNTSFLKRKVNFLSSAGFVLKFTPTAMGERGFLVKYTFDDCDLVTGSEEPFTETSPRTSASSTTSWNSETSNAAPVTSTEKATTPSPLPTVVSQSQMLTTTTSSRSSASSSTQSTSGSVSTGAYLSTSTFKSAPTSMSSYSTSKGNASSSAAFTPESSTGSSTVITSSYHSSTAATSTSQNSKIAGEQSMFCLLGSVAVALWISTVARLPF